jgi:hypothetical protein
VQRHCDPYKDLDDNIYIPSLRFQGLSGPWPTRSCFIDSLMQYMPQTSIVEWIAGATLPRQRRRRSLESPQSNTVQHRSMGAGNNSGCCPTCCSCSGCDDRSETSTDSPSKRVRFKQPKGILKHTRKVDAEEHICCSACTPSAHCNERHTVGKNGKVYGSSKKCAPKGGKKEVDNWGESKSTSNSPGGMKNTSNNNYSGKGDPHVAVISLSTFVN